MTEARRSSAPDLSFSRHWHAEVLAARPMILPGRHFVYPAMAEEVERGALEVIVRPLSPAAPEFLATCALGFRDPAVPTGIWSCPNPTQLCAVAGGYAYILDAFAPQHFTFIPLRPVLEIHPIVHRNLLLFISHHRILAWGERGEAWQSDKLSDEGVTVDSVDGDLLHGHGWRMVTDKECPFMLDWKTGKNIGLSD